MANNSLIQSANPAHSHDHESLSGRSSDEDLEIEINAFRRNTIDSLPAILPQERQLLTIMRQEVI